MKRIISLCLSLVMAATAFSAVAVNAENLNTSIDSTTISAFAEYVGDSYDKNYSFIAKFDKTDSYNDSYCPVYTIENSSAQDATLNVSVYNLAKNNYAAMSATDSVGGNNIDCKNLEVKANSSVTLYGTTISKTYAGDAAYIGVALTNATDITKNVSLKITMDAYQIQFNDDYSDAWVVEDTKSTYGFISHEFYAPVSFDYDSLEGFGNILTAISFEDDFVSADVEKALNAVSKDTDNYTQAVEALNKVITDENIEIIADTYASVYVSTKEENAAAYSVELPWAELAAGANDNAVVFTTKVTEGEKISEEELKNIQVESGAPSVDDQIALDISLLANGEAIVTPVIRQKVIVTLPSNWDKNYDVYVKHGDNGFELVEAVKDGKAIFYTDSFSNFVLAGTKSVEVNDNRTSLVNVIVRQSETSSDTFTISIAPEKDKQIINYAAGYFRIVVRNDTITDGAMKTASYTLNAGPGLVINDPIDNDETSYITDVSFIAQVPPTEEDVEDRLITAGKNQEIEIATLKLSGKGKFTIHVGGHSMYSTDSTKNYIVMKTTEEGIVDDRYATISRAENNFEIKENLHRLTFNIKYPLAISDEKDADYLDMTITIKNQSTGETRKMMVGKQGVKTADKFLELKRTGHDYGDISDDSAEASGYIELPEKATYEYEIIAGGYRTFRGSVYLDQDKTVNLWNSIYTDAKQPVIQGDSRDENQKYVTFLVGDIWMDNKVDVYDLSAVTSYFGTQDIEAGSNFVQYDLDRDGDVDLRDIGFVQLTFGN